MATLHFMTNLAIIMCGNLAVRPLFPHPLASKLLGSPPAEIVLSLSLMDRRQNWWRASRRARPSSHLPSAPTLLPLPPGPALPCPWRAPGAAKSTIHTRCPTDREALGTLLFVVDIEC